MKNNKGQAGLWIVTILMTLVVMGAFVAVSPAWDKLFTKILPMVDNTSNTFTSLQKLDTLWQNWPLVFFFSTLILTIFLVVRGRRSSQFQPPVGGF